MPPAAPDFLQSDWHYHFLGIGGVGMSALAEVLHRKGFRISGSDAQDSATLRRLAGSGIPVRVGHDPAALAGAQAVVYSTALGPSHPIWREVHRRNLLSIHRAELLGAISANHLTAAVGGTHGKTTSSACLAWVLRQAGFDPTALIGGMVPQLDNLNFCVGGGEWMVLEADESDGSFVKLKPDAVLITNIEDDHLDHHGTRDNLIAAFQEFIGLLPPGGPLVYCRDDDQTTRTLGDRASQAIGYGLHRDADVRVEALETASPATDERPRFPVALTFRDRRVELALRIPGLHNASNIAGVFALASSIGVPEDASLSAIEAFTGVARRQQYLGRIGATKIFDDYAHHPTEIRATLAAFKAQYGEPLTVVFQPHLYSRTARLAEAFAQALAVAARVIVTDVYGAREAPQPGVSGQLILDGLAGHPSARFVSTWRDAAECISADLPRGILLTLGAGDITELGPYLLQEHRDE